MFLLASVLFVLAVGFVGAAFFVAASRKRNFRSWRHYTATYDCAVSVSHGEHEAQRYRFWYTDSAGENHFFAKEGTVGLDLRIGEEVPIAVSPSGGEIEVLLPSFTNRAWMGLASIGVALAVVAVVLLITP